MCVIALQSSDDQRTFIDPLKDHFLLKNILSSELRSPLQDVRNIVKAANISTLVAPSPIIEQSYFDEICNKGQDITLVPDIRQYMQDIVLFLRNHRLVSKGVSPKSVKDFEFLVRMLSVLHDYDFATPSLVAIAAKKLFPFRIQVCHPIDEPTLKYGGDIKIVAQWMKKWDSELIVEDIINCVPPPL